MNRGQNIRNRRDFLRSGVIGTTIALSPLWNRRKNGFAMDMDHAQTNAMSLVNPKNPSRLPRYFDDRRIAPQLGCWFLRDYEISEPDGWKEFVDKVLARGSFDIICGSARFDNAESPEMVQKFSEIIAYLKNEYGIEMILDLDMRMARREFARRYPNSLQETLRLLEKPIRSEDIATEFSITVSPLTDHYTGNIPYTPQSSRLLRVWKYEKNSDGIIVKKSLRDVTSTAEILIQNSDRMEVRILHTDSETSSSYLCVAMAFAYLCADVFAPETIPYEQEIMTKYRDTGAIGAWKDEWGFPPSTDGIPAKNEYWYSEAMRLEYSRQNSNRDLIDDCFLMCRSDWENPQERSTVIDQYNRFCFEKHIEIETKFYETVKKLWGKDAFVGVHSTWYPLIGHNEFRKNGVTWWQSLRDYAQTDECAPYYARSSIAKAKGSIWYNMYYATTPSDYVIEHWSDILSGGRVNIHPLYPHSPGENEPKWYRLGGILDAGIDTIRRRLRILNFASDSPMNCPIAVIFGHYSVMNWSKPEYDHVDDAITLCDTIAKQGYGVDLIPSSEAKSIGIDGKSLWKLSSDGYLMYGLQKYESIVFCNLSESDEGDRIHLTNDLNNKKTQIITILYNEDKTSLNYIAKELVQQLQEKKLSSQTPWVDSRVWNTSVCRPPISGMTRLLDGTILWTKSQENPCGDLIVFTKETVSSNDGQTTMEFSAEATGILSLRFSQSGNLNMLTASNLRFFSGGGILIDLRQVSQEIDIALWKDSRNVWMGVFQAKNNELPESLRNITENWSFLSSSEQ